MVDAVHSSPIRKNKYQIEIIDFEHISFQLDQFEIFEVRFIQ
jgi:hypothetical protein